MKGHENLGCGEWFNMKKLGTTGGEFLRAVALVIAMLLVPVGASAHRTSDRLILAKNSTDAGQGAISPLEFDCMTTATGHRLYCRLASLPPMAAGPNPSLNDDQAVTVAPAMPTFATQNLVTQSAPESRIPVAAPQRFILFGNFRS